MLRGTAVNDFQKDAQLLPQASWVMTRLWWLPFHTRTLYALVACGCSLLTCCIAAAVSWARPIWQLDGTKVAMMFLVRFTIISDQVLGILSQADHSPICQVPLRPQLGAWFWAEAALILMAHAFSECDTTSSYKLAFTDLTISFLARAVLSLVLPLVMLVLRGRAAYEGGCGAGTVAKNPGNGATKEEPWAVTDRETYGTKEPGNGTTKQQPAVVARDNSVVAQVGRLGPAAETPAAEGDMQEAEGRVKEAAPEGTNADPNSGADGVRTLKETDAAGAVQVAGSAASWASAGGSVGAAVEASAGGSVGAAVEASAGGSVGAAVEASAGGSVGAAVIPSGISKSLLYRRRSTRTFLSIKILHPAAYEERHIIVPHIHQELALSKLTNTPQGAGLLLHSVMLPGCLQVFVTFTMLPHPFTDNEPHPPTPALPPLSTSSSSLITGGTLGADAGDAASTGSTIGSLVDAAWYSLSSLPFLRSSTILIHCPEHSLLLLSDSPGVPSEGASHPTAPRLAASASPPLVTAGNVALNAAGNVTPVCPPLPANAAGEGEAPAGGRNGGVDEEGFEGVPRGVGSGVGASNSEQHTVVQLAPPPFETLRVSPLCVSTGLAEPQEVVVHWGGGLKGGRPVGDTREWGPLELVACFVSQGGSVQTTRQAVQGLEEVIRLTLPPYLEPGPLTLHLSSCAPGHQGALLGACVTCALPPLATKELQDTWEECTLEDADVLGGLAEMLQDFGTVMIPKYGSRVAQGNREGEEREGGGAPASDSRGEAQDVVLAPIFSSGMADEVVVQVTMFLEQYFEGNEMPHCLGALGAAGAQYRGLAVDGAAGTGGSDSGGAGTGGGGGANGCADGLRGCGSAVAAAGTASGTGSQSPAACSPGPSTSPPPPSPPSSLPPSRTLLSHVLSGFPDPDLERAYVRHRGGPAGLSSDRMGCLFSLLLMVALMKNSKLLLKGKAFRVGGDVLCSLGYLALMLPGLRRRGGWRWREGVIGGCRALATLMLDVAMVSGVTVTDKGEIAQLARYGFDVPYCFIIALVCQVRVGPWLMAALLANTVHIVNTFYPAYGLGLAVVRSVCGHGLCFGAVVLMDYLSRKEFLRMERRRVVADGEKGERKKTK